MRVLRNTCTAYSRFSRILKSLFVISVFGVAAPASAACLNGTINRINDLARDTTTSTTADSTTKSSKDSIPRPPLFDSSLRYGVDTTVSPCHDFYRYANGAWRAKAILRVDSTAQHAARNLMAPRDAFRDVSERALLRLQAIVDSARSVAATTTDPALKVLGNFYESCITADSLEYVPIRRRAKHPGVSGPTRSQQCFQRTLSNLGAVLGQVFAQEVVTPEALPRMEQLLDEIYRAAEVRLAANHWMTASEKKDALDRLHKLQLRVGIPKELVDYSTLELLPTNYTQNKIAIANFGNQQWVNSIGGNIRERWKSSLLTPNAFYNPQDHAIEVPAMMFLSPFFEADGEDARNFAGVGMVIGHEIFHGVSDQLTTVENTELKAQIERLKAHYTSLGVVDGWRTDGERTFNEDVADLGGVFVAFTAWQAVSHADGKAPAPLVEGYTPEQRFFVTFARLWRATWSGNGLNRDVHSPSFARVNGVVMQMPEFAKAFGCKDGDPMVLPENGRAVIW